MKLDENSKSLLLSFPSFKRKLLKVKALLLSKLLKLTRSSSSSIFSIINRVGPKVVGFMVHSRPVLVLIPFLVLLYCDFHHILVEPSGLKYSASVNLLLE
jgi:hypothetical protein